MTDRTVFLTATDPASGVHFTAPYAFVPLDAPLPSPFGEDVPSHARPLPDGACGSIAVDWVFERPVLVGGPDANHEGGASEDTRQAAFAMNSRKRPVLPGSTTRGVIRSLLEVATGSRLDLYDRDAHFAVRDSDDKRVWKPAMPSNDGRALSFGWLRRADPDRPFVGRDYQGWVLEVVQEAYQLKTASLVPDVQAFEALAVRDKVTQLAGLGLLHIQANVQRKDAAGRYEEPNFAEFQPRGNKRGWVVVTGADPSRDNDPADPDPKVPKPKRFATLFVDQGNGPVFPVPPGVMRRFIKTHNTTPGTAGAWDFWLDRLRNEDLPADSGGARMPGIPVFIGHRLEGAAAQINPRANQSARNQNLAALLKRVAGEAGQRQAEEEPNLLYLSLSRFVKVPHTRSLRAVVEAQGHGLDTPLDFARALFGQVPSELLSAEIAEKPGRGALKGRVFFGEAELTASAPLGIPKIGVTMAPRASFWPYYLRPGEADGQPYDYSNPTALVAGWKRYPVRPQHIAFLRDDRATAPAPGPDGVRSTEARMVFLPATPAAPLTFSSVIRFHNLKPEEIGALLWALTWGGGRDGKARPQRHQVGRGKPQGYGVCHCRLRAVSISPNLGGPALDLPNYVAAFQDFVLKAWRAAHPGETVAGFDDLPMVAPLLAMADPAVSGGLESRLIHPSKPARQWQEKSASYSTPKVGAGANPESSVSLEGYKAVREAAKHQKGRGVLPPYPRSRP